MSATPASASPEAPPRLTAFAAIGDSFTAGTGTRDGSCWADRLAGQLRRGSPGLRYSNLAQEGATTTDALAQLEPAIELGPDLATVICGANDVFATVRPRPDEIAGRLAGLIDALREGVPGALVVTATVPERWRFLELGPRTEARISRGIDALNCRIRELAAERRLPLLDVAVDRGLHDSENFAPDGLHPSSLGHERAAAAFMRLVADHAPDTNREEDR